MLTYAQGVEVTGDTLKVNKVTEGGYEIWDIDKPAALTVVKEANELRMPSLKKKMAAKKAEIPTWGFDELEPREDYIGLAGSPTKVSKVFAPPVKLNKEILSGEPAEMITELIGKLKEQHVL
ncbi:MAG: electron transfer flavoprotein subunit beta, partial [Kiritimatiellales bacterium]|nr:electron transfer flavoprotein subunit beta [Kiritimatiellales bacterium]